MDKFKTVFFENSVSRLSQSKVIKFYMFVEPVEGVNPVNPFVHVASAYTWDIDNKIHLTTYLEFPESDEVARRQKLFQAFADAAEWTQISEHLRA